MTPSFTAPDWCGLSWTAYVPFRAWQGKLLPTGAGLYRVRIDGADRLAYVGQTGRNLRERLAKLRAHTLAAEMPFNDPHTAAPRLWSYRVEEGLEYEASACRTDMAKSDRMALECYLVWRYRREAGGSTLCNFGRMHADYTAPRNKATGVQGGRREALMSDGTSGGSVPGLSRVGRGGRAGGAGWMGMGWSPPAPLTTSVGRLSATQGVYIPSRATGEVVYIGQSRILPRRLRTHARSRSGLNLRYSLCELPSTYGLAQLLEVENDLVAGFYAEHRKAPLFQFRERIKSPVD